MVSLALLIALAACSGSPRSVRSHGAHPPPAPPGIEAALLTPLPDNQLAQANRSADEVFASLPIPPELAPAPPSVASSGTGPAAVGVEQEQDAEPPVAAQRAYLAGRSALRQGRADEAIAQLEQVLRLAPRSAAAMRMLGQIHAAGQDPIRAEQYLSQAVRIDPSHAPTLFALGRLAAEQGDPARGLALMRGAMNRIASTGAARETAMVRLGYYHGAALLARMGQARAAIEWYERFLGDPTPPRGSPGTMQELAMLIQQARAIHQTLGDLRHQLHEPAEAARAYERAGGGNEPGVVLSLAPRRVYTDLILGDHAAASGRVVRLLGDTHGGGTALQLAHYAVAQGVAVKPILAELARLRADDKHADASALVIAMADLSPRQAKRLLLQRLEQAPDDMRVFDRLIDEQPADSTDAILTTAQLMTRYPPHAELYGLTLLNAADDPLAFAATFDGLAAGRRAGAMVRVLEGLAMANLARVDEAERAFEDALRADPGSLVARLQLAKVQIARRRFAEAATLLEPIGPTDDPAVIALRVRVLTETGDAAGAMAMLDEAIGSGRADPALILHKARLQAVLGDAQAGADTLQQALDQDPTREAYYEALFQLYQSQDAAGRPLIRDGQLQSRRLMRRMLAQIPDSRIGRLKRAQGHVAQRQYGAAAALLENLVEQDHRDLIALGQLLDVLIQAGRAPQAAAMMQDRIQRFGNDPQVLRLAADCFTRLGDAEKVAAVRERMLRLLPEGDEKLFSLAALYLSTERGDEAATMLADAMDRAATDDPQRLMLLLAAARIRTSQPDRIDSDFEQAMRRFPDHAGDLHYRWALTYSLREDQPGYERMLERTHEKFPDHAATNNDLGYLWVERHHRVAEAAGMIASAVEREPANAAYLDSLGWAYYKLGRFEEAAARLRQSEALTNQQLQAGDTDVLTTQVVVLDHLGDALYRLGETDLAQDAWRRAQRVLANLTIDSHADLIRVRQSLADKIAALRNQTPAPVAPIPPEPPPPEAPPPQASPETSPFPGSPAPPAVSPPAPESPNISPPDEHEV